jgi:hypothetical protein
VKLNPKKKTKRIKRVKRAFGLRYVWSKGKQRRYLDGIEAFINPRSLNSLLHIVDRDLPQLHLYTSAINWFNEKKRKEG